MTKETLEQAAERIVRQEVLCCMSHIVHALAQPWNVDHVNEVMDEMHDQAQELAAPVPDYEESLLGNGAQIRHDMLGFYALTNEEAEHEDTNNPSVGFDGREHFASIEDAARAYCEENDIEPYDREVFEHWAVSDWFADKLIEQGEKVDNDFGNLCIWARTTTGQGIAMDSVVEKIARQIVEA